MEKTILEERIEKLEIQLEEEICKKDEYRKQANSFWDEFQDSTRQVEDLYDKIEELGEKKNIDAFSEEILDSRLTGKPVYIGDYKHDRIYINIQ